MNANKKFLSICIPSYNRPEGLKRAIESIDSENYVDELQVVICEDCAPRRIEIRKVVEEYAKRSKYDIKYVENTVNLGHGKNWRKCAHEADGFFLMYIGDDDMIAPKALDPYIKWLHQHDYLGYICRAYQTLNIDGTISVNRYYKKDIFLKPGIKSVIEFFMKSNLMTGYTIRRDYTFDFEDDSIDFTLYYQMYLMGEICLRYPSGYCNIPIGQYVGDGISYFGVNEVEKDYYKPGTNAASELSNINKFFIVTKLIDTKNNIDTTSVIKKDFAKYSSYPTMFKYSRINYDALKKCKKELIKMGLSNSIYFNIYFYSLYILGPKLCHYIVNTIKIIYGARPKL